ncbi:MAG: DNA adenine methylase [Planctomycetota bacterium]
MRYLGNKVRLLPEIEAAARRIGFTRGTVCDLFAGTATVGHYFRARGNSVVATDLMECSYVFQRVLLELEAPPEFAKLRTAIDVPTVRVPASARKRRVVWGAAFESAQRVLNFLSAGIEPVAGFVTRQYSPEGVAGRCYFRPETAQRIDAVLLALRDWRARDLIDDDERNFLLAALINAADGSANISGTYGAYHKDWQDNTSRPFVLLPPEEFADAAAFGPRGVAHRREASEWLPSVKADLLYIDPPYNNRQYAPNYHLLETLARIPTETNLAALEASLYGKTGMLPWTDKSSRLCRSSGRDCAEAFRELLQSTSIPRVVISYNEEGLITRDEFLEMLAEYADVPRAELGDDVLTEISYRRFRSDADGRVSSTGTGRSYRQLAGRDRNEVNEWLFHVAKSSVAKRRRA